MNATASSGVLYLCLLCLLSLLLLLYRLLLYPVYLLPVCSTALSLPAPPSPLLCPPPVPLVMSHFCGGGCSDPTDEEIKKFIALQGGAYRNDLDGDNPFQWRRTPATRH